ncbi:hypothetical protein LNKW23_48590 [Paralimibaculum aggregatum]|uniref:Uncharacterized protein n=1 Tax=Paralimibaculum aggregatum TaxID=3036245 RepID=A0ABQ6LU83_9RHOB|nr:hypothetical protein LNKW23_48590 [Limibaculum sp. NKW23]
MAYASHENWKYLAAAKPYITYIVLCSIVADDYNFKMSVGKILNTYAARNLGCPHPFSYLINKSNSLTSTLRVVACNHCDRILTSSSNIRSGLTRVKVRTFGNITKGAE